MPPTEEDILQGKIADLCESPMCNSDDEFFKEIQQALKLKELVKKKIEKIKSNMKEVDQKIYEQPYYNDIVESWTQVYTKLLDDKRYHEQLLEESKK